jgi:hypothetical protein
MTSGATAYASGVAALVLSANPMLSNVEVAEILKNTADKIDIEKAITRMDIHFSMGMDGSMPIKLYLKHWMPKANPI